MVQQYKQESIRQLLDTPLVIEQLKYAIESASADLLVYDFARDEYVSIEVKESDRYLQQLIDFVYKLSLSSGVALSSAQVIIEICERIVMSGQRSIIDGKVIVENGQSLFTLMHIASWEQLLQLLDIRD